MAIVVSGGTPAVLLQGSMECFDLATHTRSSMHIPNMPAARHAHASVAIDDKLYVLGGQIERKVTNTISVYDKRQNVWTDGPAMPSCHEGHAAVVLDKNIYVIGGANERGWESKLVEVLQAQTKKWSSVSPMSLVRKDCGAAVAEGKIYVAGGYDGKICLSSVEVYTPENNTWKQLPPLRTARYALCLGALGDQVYAVGGCSGKNQFVDSTEVYSMGTNVWSTIAKLNTPRGWFGLVAHECTLYAVGGESTDDTILKSIERYIPTTIQWTKVPCEMEALRYNFGVAILN